MRITNSMIVQRQIDGLQANMSAIDTAQSQVSSGKRVQIASDDPTAASGIMTAASSIRALEQYKSNVSSASDRVGAEDSALQQLTDLMTRAQQIAGQAGSATALDRRARAAASSEADSLLQSAVQLGNSKFGSEYLFGGDQSTTAPFGMTGSGTSAAYTSTGATGQRSVAIGDGDTMVVSHTADQVFVASGVLDALVKLTGSLASGDIAGIDSANTALQGSFDTVQGFVGDVGARGNQLLMTSTSLDTLEGTVTNHKSDLQDVDAATAITELTSRQTAYQAALLAISKTGTLSLTDYLT